MPHSAESTPLEAGGSTATSTRGTQQRQEEVKDDVQKEDSTLTETDREMGSAKADKADESGNAIGQVLDHIDFSKPPPNVVSIQLPPATTRAEVCLWDGLMEMQRISKNS